MHHIKPKKIVAVILLLAIALAIALITIANTQANDLRIINRLLPIQIDSRASIIQRTSDFSGWMGDGTLYYKIRVDPAIIAKIAADRRNWKPLPIAADIKSGDGVFPGDFPLKLKRGYYYLHDFQGDWYPDSTELQHSMWQRSSWNFVMAILDIENALLYVYKLDT